MKKSIISNHLKFNNLDYPLCHVGTIDVSKKSKCSYEGNGLSVSMHPLAWERIARIGGDTWELKKDNINLLDYYKVSKEDYNKITEWGVENGYLEAVFGRYIYSYYDDEFCQRHNMPCDDLEEALSYLDLEGEYDTYEEFLNSEDYLSEEELLEAIEEDEDNDEATIYPIKSYNATKKLQEKSLVDANNGICPEEQNFLLYVEEHNEYDGVYWNEKLDVSKLSAPRGVIFNSRLASFDKELADLEKINKNLFEEDDEYDKDEF